MHPALKDEMQRVERLSTAETNAGLLEGEQVQASSDLYHLLLHSTSRPALDRVVHAGSAEGLRAWQLLVEWYDPDIRSRTAGQLLSLLQFDFSGDMLAKLEAFERDLALYDQASGEKISDGLRVGTVLNRVTDTELATHFLLNSERFQTWALFRRELVDVSRARAAASGAYQMRRGANDSNTAPMEIDALQQHGDKKCHTCGRFGHLAKDCWQNKSKIKGKDSKGKGGLKGKGKGKGKTDKDVCLKCGQQGHWAKNCPNPAKAIHGLDGQNGASNGWWQWNDGQEWKTPSEQSTVESQRAAPSQPMAEPETAMGRLWLASLTAVAESKQMCETSPTAEIVSLEGHAADRITFGVDSFAALTVIGKDVAAGYPRVQGLARRMTDCQGNRVVNFGQKDLASRGPTGRSFARVTVASVAKNLLSVSSLLKTGHEVVFSSGKSYIQHLKTDARQPMVEKNGVFEVSYDLSPYAVGLKPPPRRDE